MSRLTNSSGLPYKIVIESGITHVSSSSQEALLRKTAARGSREEWERSQSVPLTLPASYSLFLVCGPFPHCLSLPFQPMYSQYSLSGSVCVFCVSRRDSTTSLRVEILSNLICQWSARRISQKRNESYHTSQWQNIFYWFLYFKFRLVCGGEGWEDD